MEMLSICRFEDFHLWYGSGQHLAFAMVALLGLMPLVIALRSRKRKKETSDLTYADFEKCIGEMGLDEIKLYVRG